MRLEKIYDRVNKGRVLTESQLRRILKHNKNLRAYAQTVDFNDDDGTIDVVKYRLIPACGTSTPCKDIVYATAESGIVVIEEI